MMHCVCAVASVICGVFMWATKLQPVPRVDGKLAKALLPIALFHTIGHVSACVSFSLMAISFSHVIKASEPVRQPHRCADITFPWILPETCGSNDAVSSSHTAAVSIQ